MGLFDSFRKKFSSGATGDRSSLSRKIQEAPQDPQARQKLGLYLLRAGEIVEGIDQLARSAILYEKGGFTTKAIAVLRQILKNDPANIEFLRWLIRLLAQHGHTGDALSELQKVASGGVRFATDDQRIEFYRGVMENLPDNPLPSLLVADVDLYQRKLFEAVSELERIARLVAPSQMEKEFASRMNVLSSLAGENPDLLEPCGFLWFAAGKPEEALSYLTKAAEFSRSSGDPEHESDADQVISAIEQGEAELSLYLLQKPHLLVCNPEVVPSLRIRRADLLLHFRLKLLDCTLNDTLLLASHPGGRRHLFHRRGECGRLRF